jgi:hypothetical protein
MPSDITVHIEIKKYLKKYLIAVYGPEPVTFPHGHQYNRFLVRKLSKVPVNHKPVIDRDNCIEIFLPWNNLIDVRYYNHLSVDDKQAFRYEIDRDFMYDYIKFIDDKCREGFNRMQATAMCQNLYGINDEDISFDAFYKNFYRKAKIRFDLQKSFSIFKNNSQNSPHVNLQL